VEDASEKKIRVGPENSDSVPPEHIFKEDKTFTLESPEIWIPDYTVSQAGQSGFFAFMGFM
jgi:hypothetical protein